MPRRNYRPERRAEARRLANQETSKQFYAARPESPRDQLLPMVKTEGRCPTGKMRYATAADAEEALRRALINREILQSPVVEERWYPQPGDAPCMCRGYHLTHSKRRKP